MIKKIMLIIASGIAYLSSPAQNITPVVTNEFCPLQNITFTVTLPRIKDNTVPTVASWTNTPNVISGISSGSIVNTPTQTTCTFVGSFKDININQVFKVDYVPDGGSTTSAYFSFKKIKSLYYNNPAGTNPK